MTIIYPAAGAPTFPVSDLDITSKVPAPVTGGTSVTYFAAPQYTGWVVWLSGGIAMPHSVFQSNVAYTAKVTLTVASGYTFGDPAVNFTHTGTSAITTTTDAALTVTIVFPATTGVAAIPVNDLNLTYKVPAPVNGGTPANYFSAPQYTENVVWTFTSGGQALGSLFGAFTEYTAAITLIAASGYTFTGVPANGFTHGGAMLITHISGDTVSVRFPATTGVTAAAVNDLDLTGVLSTPIAEASLLMNFNTGTYHGTAAWRTSGGVAMTMFESAPVYTATVTLYPETGYSFPAGLPVTHGTIGIANFTGAPRQGTVTFPATGILSFYSGPFSGSSAGGTGDRDSAIDMIRAAKTVGHTSLYLQLGARIDETVDLYTANRDITGGLVLDTGTSPANVVIDGGKRTIKLGGTDTSKPIITIKNGVTLTLRNITLRSTITTSALFVVEDGGNLILETGAVINVAEGGTVSIVPGATPGTYDEVHIFCADSTITTGGQATHSLIFNNPTRPAEARVLVVGGSGGGLCGNKCQQHRRCRKVCLSSGV